MCHKTNKQSMCPLLLLNLSEGSLDLLHIAVTGFVSFDYRSLIFIKNNLELISPCALDK